MFSFGVFRVSISNNKLVLTLRVFLDLITLVEDPASRLKHLNVERVAHEAPIDVGDGRTRGHGFNEQCCVQITGLLSITRAPPLAFGHHITRFLCKPLENCRLLLVLGFFCWVGARSGSEAEH